MRYEFTVTLRPYLYKFTAREQKSMVQGTLKQLFAGIACSAVFELTGENNVHLHAMVELRDFIHRDHFLNRWRLHNKVFGRKTCTPLTNEPKWREYMRKDLATTRALIGDPILMDDFQVFVDPQFRQVVV